MARLRWFVLLSLIAVAVVSSLWAVSRTGDWEGLALSIGAEMAGAVVTYALFELVIGLRERHEAERRAVAENKEDLVAQLGSQVHDVAVAAAEELRRHGWLEDGSLRGANLFRANLGKANLARADLRDANLCDANLRGADLCAADLSGAALYNADLSRAIAQDAILCNAKLSGANMGRTQLTRADMSGALLLDVNLERAYLAGARVTGRQLGQARSLEDAIMPDGAKHD